MKTLFLLISILMISCNVEVSKERKLIPKEHTIIIDGCEYLYFENGNKGSNNYNFTLTHKGNCNNHTNCK